MRLRKATIAALLLTARRGGRWRSPSAAATTPDRRRKRSAVPGEPAVSIISPRNGARQTRHAVVVKVAIENFQLAPRQFGREPQLGEGHIRFSLNRVPDCVDPVKLRTRDQQPDRQRPADRRLLRLSRNTPAPTACSPSGSAPPAATRPATRPEIYYHDLRPASTALIVNLAQNNGSPTPSTPSPTSRSCRGRAHGPKPCPKRQSPERQGRGKAR